MSDAAADTWEIFDETTPFAGALYGPQRVRMAAIGLGGGSLLVVSPGAPVSDAGWEQLARLGTPRFLLAPNHFHSLGIATWKARFPEAAVVAHPRALPRLRRKVPGVDIQDLAPLQAALPDGVRVFGPPMAAQGETWVSVKTAEGVGWFVTDAIFNGEGQLRGAAGLFLRLLGFRARLMTNPIMMRLFVSDKATYKEWMRAELERDRPVLFVPAHGGALRGAEVVSRLQAVTDAA